MPVGLADWTPLGDRPVGGLTEDVIEAAFVALGPLAGSTWNRYRGLLLGLQRWGLRKGYLTSP